LRVIACEKPYTQIIAPAAVTVLFVMLKSCSVMMLKQRLCSSHWYLHFYCLDSSTIRNLSFRPWGTQTRCLTLWWNITCSGMA